MESCGMSTADLAVELDLARDQVDVLVGLLIGIDGDEATVSAVRTVRNSSGRPVGESIELTRTATAYLRQIAAGFDRDGLLAAMFD